MTRVLKILLVLVCTPLCAIPWQSASAQGDVFNNNTRGEPQDCSQYKSDERDGWECTGDPNRPPGETVLVWCHGSPDMQSIICLKPGELPPYLQNGGSGRTLLKGSGTFTQAPESSPSYPPPRAVQPRGGPTPARAKAAAPLKSGTIRSGNPSSAPSQADFAKIAKSEGRSFVIFGKAKSNVCQYVGKQLFNAPDGRPDEWIYICLSGGHTVGDSIPGDIQGPSGRYFTTIVGRFTGTQFAVTKLNGAPLGGHEVMIGLTTFQ